MRLASGSLAAPQRVSKPGNLKERMTTATGIRSVGIGSSFAQLTQLHCSYIPPGLQDEGLASGGARSWQGVRLKRRRDVDDKNIRDGETRDNISSHTLTQHTPQHITDKARHTTHNDSFLAW